MSDDIYRSVTFPSPERTVPAPRELPSMIGAHYTNYTAQQDRLTEYFRSGDGRPMVAIIRGTPGSGRSTLAVKWAVDHCGDYPDGQFVVRLGPHDDRDETVKVELHELLTRVGYGADQILASLEGRAAMWRSWSADRQILMVIDDALTAAQVRSLLPGVGPSAVLVIESGRLTGLGANIRSRYIDIDPLNEESARLLLARMIGHHAADAEPEAVEMLVRRCAGSALALCVVGATLAEDERSDGGRIARFAAKLADDERVLRELSRDAELSLKVVFDAAYRRLGALAQECYRAFGAHPGNGDIAVSTLAAVLDKPADDVEYACETLRKARLVAETSEGRYLTVGLLGQHARLVSHDHDGGTLRRAVVQYYWRLALEASVAWMPTRGWYSQLWPELRISSTAVDPPSARRWMRDERTNLRSATEAAFDLGQLSWACQLGVAQWPLHDQGKHSHDMRAVNTVGIKAAVELGDRGVAALLRIQRGFACRQQRRWNEATGEFNDAAADARAVGSLALEATAVESAGQVLREQGRLVEATELLTRNLGLAEVIGATRRLAMARFHLGTVVAAPDDALSLLDQARAGFEPSVDAYTLCKIELWRGKRLIEVQRLDDAAAVLAGAGADAADGGWPHERAHVCCALADLALVREETAVALSHLRDAADIFLVQAFAEDAAAVLDRITELE